MKISDPNPFFRMMREKDPTLFVTDTDGKYQAYSRSCPWNTRRQPVILTDEEKNKIDTEHPGSYEHAIKYGSNPDKQFWYICPRYWDLKNNVSLTEEEVESGKYGGVIPQKINGKPTKVVPPGKNIWEFTDPKVHNDKNGNYVTHYPGFLKEDAHPDGLCVPCCFKTWDSESQLNRRKKCNQDVIEKIDDTDKRPSKQDMDEYIKGPDKFPLQEGRLGYLPVQLQRFLMVTNTSCHVSKINTNLRKNKPCYLRKGVEGLKKVSFLGCIADIYSEVNDNKVISIKTLLTDKILKILTIDNFVQYQNGNLITEFQSKELKNINVDEYSDTKVYKLFNDKNNIQLEKIVSAYKNFKEYLTSPNSVIDYTYLWDLICERNELLFPNGINMIILELPQDDITSNVNIICPSNIYSNNKYDETKDTIILIKKYEFFEPIYIVTDSSKGNMTKINAIKLYTPELFKKLPNLIKINKNIRDIYSSMCKPMPSILNIANKYNFKEIKFVHNHTLNQIIDILNTHKIEINKLVVNYDNKTIGLIISNEGREGFIPCFPSEMILEYDIISMDDLSDYTMTFEETIDFLQNIKKKSNNKLLCMPVVKIKDNGLIVGILTETNQFIELKEPEQDSDMSLKYSIDDDNYYNVDKVVQNSDKIDNERKEYIKKIELETKMYNAFRNKLKKLLSSFDNIAIRDEIENISNSKYLIYHLQLEKLITLLKRIMNDHVEFVNVTPNKISLIEENVNSNGELLITKQNLMSKLDNETNYYSKLADELIRYNRIKLFMFEPKMFLNFNDMKYNLSSNEIILLQSLLTQDYFDDLVPSSENKYISFNSYDNVEPNLTQKYDNEYIDDSVVINKDLSDDKPMKSDFKIYSNCNNNIKNIFSQLKVKFSGGFKEIEFSDENYSCTFDVAITLVNNTISNKKTIIEVKNILIDEYKKLLLSNSESIKNILNTYIKPAEYALFNYNEITIDEIILNEKYNLNPIDIMILSKKYNIPIIFVASRQFKENDSQYMKLNATNEAYIIRVPGFNKYKIKPSKYRMLYKNKDALIDISSISNKVTRQNIEGSNITIETVLNYYKNYSEELDETIDTIDDKNKSKAKKLSSKLKLID